MTQAFSFHTNTSVFQKAQECFWKQINKTPLHKLNSY